MLRLDQEIERQAVDIRGIIGNHHGLRRTGRRTRCQTIGAQSHRGADPRRTRPDDLGATRHRFGAKGDRGDRLGAAGKVDLVHACRARGHKRSGIAGSTRSRWRDDHHPWDRRRCVPEWRSSGSRTGTRPCRAGHSRPRHRSGTWRFAGHDAGIHLDHLERRWKLAFMNPPDMVRRLFDRPGSFLRHATGCLFEGLGRDPLCDWQTWQLRRNRQRSAPALDHPSAARPRRSDAPVRCSPPCRERRARGGRPRSPAERAARHRMRGGGFKDASGQSGEAFVGLGVDTHFGEHPARNAEALGRRQACRNRRRFASGCREGPRG